LRYFGSAGYIVNKHDHRWIWTLWTCSCVCGIGAADIEVPIFDTYQ